MPVIVEVAVTNIVCIHVKKHAIRHVLVDVLLPVWETVKKHVSLIVQVAVAMGVLHLV